MTVCWISLHSLSLPSLCVYLAFRRHHRAPVDLALKDGGGVGDGGGGRERGVALAVARGDSGAGGGGGVVRPRVACWPAAHTSRRTAVGELMLYTSLVRRSPLHTTSSRASRLTVSVELISRDHSGFQSFWTRTRRTPSDKILIGATMCENDAHYATLVHFLKSQPATAVKYCMWGR